VIGTLWHNRQMHRVAIKKRESGSTLTVHGKILRILFKILNKASLFLFLCVIQQTFFQEVMVS